MKAVPVPRNLVNSDVLPSLRSSQLRQKRREVSRVVRKDRGTYMVLKADNQ